MSYTAWLSPLLLFTSLSLLVACNDYDQETPDSNTDKLSYHSDWPDIRASNNIQPDPSIETAVANILAQMTLEEKVGQMIQPNLDDVTPAEAQQYKLGSLLNGGGSWPNKNKRASASDWVAKADEYWLALEAAYQNRGFHIPFMWATDAVHGHNNVFQATVFPHNIGLGAANNPDLIYQIGQATAKEIAATGLDWTFAPTVAAPRDYRWGRVYEGYSEDPEIIYSYARKVVEGLQGGADGLKTDQHVISNVKHWLGDGGTSNGVDRGKNEYTEEYLINIHAAGYLSGLSAGAQVVMSSFNTWEAPANYAPTDNPNYNKKIHGSRYLINDVLKDKMGFDGLVVTDWNGQGEINDCTASNCPAAVNAGNDIFMVTANSDWKAFYTNVIDQVNSGVIPIARIDDAVTRILRVKMRAGLWDKPKPSERSLAGNQSILGAPEHRALARQAVSESLVLLKNQNNALPLSTTQPILLAGSAMNTIQKQTGGWSLTWQGDNNTLADFPGATTVKMALEKLLGADNVITDRSLATANMTAIVVIGEDPYAEFFGDIKDHQTLSYAELKASYRADLQTIKDLKMQGFKVVTVFLSGRPMYVNEEINHSDAFVAAWLPGTEAEGITDVLYSVGGMDFKGRLSYSWPMRKCSTSINRETPTISGYITPKNEQSIHGEHAPLFPYGYGLSYTNNTPPAGIDLDTLPLDPRNYGCGQDQPDTGVANTSLEIYGTRAAADEYALRISGNKNGWAAIPVLREQPADQGTVSTAPINYQGQYDAVNIFFNGDDLAQIYLQTADEQGQDKNAYLNAESTLQFDIRMHQLPTAPLNIAQHCVWPCLGQLELNKVLPPISENWSTLKIPLSCFAEQGMNFAAMNTPLLLLTGGEARFDLGNVRIVPRSLDPASSAFSCSDFSGETKPPLDENPSNFLGNDTWKASITTYTAKTGSDWSPADDFISTNMSGSGIAQEVAVSYNPASPADYKGIVFLEGNAQDLSNYTASGKLSFDLYIEDYASNVSGLVIKMESTTTPGPDYPLGLLATGVWHTVTIPVQQLGLDERQIKSIHRPLAILPTWDEPHNGVKFRFKNARLTKQ